MKHNTNDHSNAVYFALLNLADDGTYSISHVEINGQTSSSISKNISDRLSALRVMPACIPRASIPAGSIIPLHRIPWTSIWSSINADGSVNRADIRRTIPFLSWINILIPPISLPISSSMLSGTFPDRQRISLPSSISPIPAHAWSSNAMWIFPGFPCPNIYPWMRYISISNDRKKKELEMDGGKLGKRWKKRNYPYILAL